MSGAGWGVLLGLLLASVWVRGRVLRLRARQRLLRAASDGEEVRPPRPSALRRWLRRAGYTDPAVPWVFAGATLAGLGLGVLALAAVWASGVLAQLGAGLVDLPGGMGGIFLPILYGAPWLLVCVLVGAPTLVVRATRRERVARVERELPLFLELLATLAQAGLAFDGALERILASRDPDSPLTRAWRGYQADLRAGARREDALRGVSRDLEVGGTTVLISALVQAEQLGTSLADTLRAQAQELRGRRRERVLIAAEALSVKLVFPLVICFMPALFVFTLGPAFHQLFELTDRFTQGVERPAPPGGR